MHKTTKRNFSRHYKLNKVHINIIFSFYLACFTNLLSMLDHILQATRPSRQSTINVKAFKNFHKT